MNVYVNGRKKKAFFVDGMTDHFDNFIKRIEKEGKEIIIPEPKDTNWVGWNSKFQIVELKELRKFQFVCELIIILNLGDIKWKRFGVTNILLSLDSSFYFPIL